MLRHDKCGAFEDRIKELEEKLKLAEGTAEKLIEARQDLELALNYLRFGFPQSAYEEVTNFCSKTYRKYGLEAESKARHRKEEAYCPSTPDGKHVLPLLWSVPGPVPCMKCGKDTGGVIR